MEILRLEQVNKSFGDKLLFENINLSISQGDKIALVAKNGSGKTTLLKIVAGDEAAEGENAKIYLNKDVRVAYLRQRSNFDEELRIKDIIVGTDHPKLKALNELSLAQSLNDKSKIEEALAKAEELNAWDIESQYEEILSKFGFDNLDQKVKSLSGGEQKRLDIARIVISDPEFLILDEPTNHLDIDMIEWLEQYFSHPKRTMLMVTHDRYFLDSVCNEIIEIDQAQVHSYRGNYSQFLEKKAMRLQNQQVRKEKMSQLYKKELDWIRRSPAARTTKSKSRIDRFDDIEKAAKVQIGDTLVQIPVQIQRLGSKILEAHAISKSYGERKIIEEFSYKFKKFEKVGIVGPNGAGKTTFLNIITKALRPDAGKIVIGDTVVFGHFKQEGLNLEQDKRVIDVIRDIAEYLPLEKGQKLSADALLERFLFPRSQQRVYVSQLSGGELRRLHLLTVIMKNPNFLILDEPTNDLDIMTLNVLEDYLKGFPGVVLIVSHDRFLLDKLVDHLFIIKGDGRIQDYNGSYSQYRREHGKIFITKSSKVEAKEETTLEKDTLSHEEKKKHKNRLRKIERELELLTSEKADILSKFETQEINQDVIPVFTKRLDVIKSTIESLEEEWLTLSMILD